MAIETSTKNLTIQNRTQISIFPGDTWHYSVQDHNIETSMDGCTISYWQNGNRKDHITMEPDEAIALADAIYKLFKKN